MNTKQILNSNLKKNQEIIASTMKKEARKDFPMIKEEILNKDSQDPISGRMKMEMVRGNSNEEMEIMEDSKGERTRMEDIRDETIKMTETGKMTREDHSTGVMRNRNLFKQ